MSTVAPPPTRIFPHRQLLNRLQWWLTRLLLPLTIPMLKQQLLQYWLTRLLLPLTIPMLKQQLLQWWVVGAGVSVVTLVEKQL